ncbi:hypothetical protein L9F63_026971 [Diploptera punctata]|uniref:eIF-4F 25 kDa subunit n=1 Tax=Diploptera punctata TaxID=6984 RepID=A0AAD8ADR2_DIPPU|nr:hypothetical protein L9F63_026971 [Diploptera punctata]
MTELKVGKKINERITSFDTAEDFWSLYNHIKTASELRQGCDYSLFKEGIRPMWEDEANKRGGRWLINLNKNQRGNELDKYWLEILLCMMVKSLMNIVKMYVGPLSIYDLKEIKLVYGQQMDLKGQKYYENRVSSCLWRTALRIIVVDIWDTYCSHLFSVGGYLFF